MSTAHQVGSLGFERGEGVEEEWGLRQRKGESVDMKRKSMCCSQAGRAFVKSVGVEESMGGKRIAPETIERIDRCPKQEAIRLDVLVFDGNATRREALIQDLSDSSSIHLHVVEPDILDHVSDSQVPSQLALVALGECTEQATERLG